MTASGLSAVEALDAAYARGGYVLAMEGGVPTAFGGAAGWAMTDASGHELTIAEAVQKDRRTGGRDHLHGDLRVVGRHPGIRRQSRRHSQRRVVPRQTHHQRGRMPPAPLTG